jgi:acyl dehydratase
MPPEPLPEYRVKARNTSRQGENAIHDDTVARQYGFRGAFVPGVTIYAYMTHPVVQALGPAWLARGTASVRFLKPILENEEVVVGGEVSKRDARGITATVTARTESSGECAVATVTLPAGSPTPVNRALYAEAPLPAERPVATRAYLESLDRLGTPVATYDDALATAYVEEKDDDLALYRGPDGHVHPAFLLTEANRALSRNVRVSPWIHVGSAVRHLAAARVGDTLSTRGRVRSLFEKKGREFCELDLLVVSGPNARPVAHILHTAIYRLPAPPA